MHPAENRAKAASDSLQDLAAEIESSHRLILLGTMTAAIAHEINNALTPVITYCQLASGHPDDRALQAKAIERAMAGAERAARIAAIVLSVSRETPAGGGGLRAEADACDVAEVARAVVGSLVRDPAKDGVELRVEVDDGLPRVRMRASALHQVLLNLVLNAVRAVRGGGIVTVRARMGDGAVIEVEDNGPGIPLEIQERLFKPFASGHRGSGGNGLGLLVVRMLVEDAGGRVSVRTGEGTTFTIALPTALQKAA